MEFDENSKNCHLSQEGSEQEFVTILLPIGEEIWRYSENSDGWSDPDYRYTPNRSNFSKNFFGFMYLPIWSKQGSTMLWNLKIPDLKFRGFFAYLLSFLVRLSTGIPLKRFFPIYF